MTYIIKARLAKFDAPTIRQEATVEGMTDQLDYFLSLGYTCEVTFDDSETEAYNTIKNTYQEKGHKVA